MAKLRQMALELGLSQPQTYIQSGNLWLDSPWESDETQARLEQALSQELGKTANLILLTQEFLQKTLDGNPFANYPGHQVLVSFYAAPPAQSPTSGPDGEQVHQVDSVVYVYFPGGSGRSRLKLPKQPVSTTRNINTLQRLLEMSLCS